MCYLDILDNLPRLRLSSSQLKMILWIMNACGAKDVPSFNAFRAMQKHIRKTTGVRSEPHKSDLGNFFYVNDIRDLIAKKYPEDVAVEGKWHNIPLDALTPSILIKRARYYIHEVAELSDGQWVIPALWIVSKGKTYADSRLVEKDPDNSEILVVQSAITRIPLDDFSFNHEALERRLGHSISFHEYSQKIPNRFRTIDNGDDLFTVWVPVWADDVLGARSKQYQKTSQCVYCERKSTGQLLQQEYFVPLEQLKVVVDHVKSTHEKPVPTYNAETDRPCSWTATKCRNIRSCVLSQLRLATYGVASHVEALQTSTGTKDKIAQHWIDILIPKAREMQTASTDHSADDISNALLVWLSEQTDQPYNPLLDLPLAYCGHFSVFDPSQDTLQVIFTVRLQGTNLDGLRVPPIRAAYMMQYRNGLIGKHFKTPMQTMIFHIHDIVTPEQFSLVRALGELGPLLWMPVIDNMDEYLADLQILIDNSPRRLRHTRSYENPDKTQASCASPHCKRHPTARAVVRFSTEVFECFNAIFRLCSVLSNHQAPSRDIAAKFADLDRVKHILSGGYWFEESESAWVNAGKDVRRILRNTPIIQRHLGWAPPPIWTPGLIKAVAQKKQSKLAALTLEEAMLTGAINPMSVAIDPSASWTNGVNVAARTGDCCTLGSWAVFRVNNLPMIARISKILLLKGSKSAQRILVVNKYDVGEALHPHYHMPVLLPDGAANRVIVASDSIQFAFNVQHDCRACGCDASGVTRQMQERQESETIIHSIVHKDDARFIINTHGFHNAGLLRKYLPVALTKPRLGDGGRMS
ncbi:hypothetical protein B0H19DRAFT_1213675 [Mycena capillaripes]|nr:hypothetical protein B0H19DRAFT_1213675 [Mycena capillaripes]